MIRYILIGIAIVAAIILLRRLFGRRPIEPFSQQPSKPINQEGAAVAAEVEGQELDIDAAVLDEVRRLSANGQKIEAIKHLRDATGLGLAEAKRIVDSLDQIHK